MHLTAFGVRQADTGCHKYCHQGEEKQTAASGCPKGYTLGAKDETEVNRSLQGLQFSFESFHLGHLKLD